MFHIQYRVAISFLDGTLWTYCSSVLVTKYCPCYKQEVPPVALPLTCGKILLVLTDAVVAL